MGVAASGSVLIRCSVAQGRMPVSVVVLVLESPITTRASNRVVQWLRLRHSFLSLLLNDSM